MKSEFKRQMSEAASWVCTVYVTHDRLVLSDVISTFNALLLS